MIPCVIIYDNLASPFLTIALFKFLKSKINIILLSNKRRIKLLSITTIFCPSIINEISNWKRVVFKYYILFFYCVKTQKDNEGLKAKQKKSLAIT